MDAQKNYEMWLSSPHIDNFTKKELLGIKNNPTEIVDRFAKTLEFGTGGVRSLMGAGANRINVYTICRITSGLANYLLTLYPNPKVVIAYDTRHNSKLFANTIANRLNQHNIAVYLFPDVRPTPLLSFAVRELNAATGIIITASHNPPQYNGYKVYSSDGVQVTPDIAEQIINHINSLPLIVDPLPKPAQKGEIALTLPVGSDTEEKYIQALMNTMLNKSLIHKHASYLQIIYTPLHGVGATLLPKVLRTAGFSAVQEVKEQVVADPEFSTVRSPNPEDREAYELALRYAKDQSADLILATDPDADRLGIMICTKDQDYVMLSGNQLGGLLLEYILSQQSTHGRLRSGSVMIKSIVTSEFGEKIAAKYGVKTINTLTGFKYIGEQISLMEKSEQEHFVFGYEESYGYLADTYVRDKDGIMSAALVSEMALYYKLQDKTLDDVLQELFEEHGYFEDRLISFTFEGLEGQDKMTAIIDLLRNDPPTEFGSERVIEINDYLQKICLHIASNNKTPISLPSSNTLQYKLVDDSLISMRPSGTEPKLKIYLSVQGPDKETAKQKILTLEKEILRMLAL